LTYNPLFSGPADYAVARVNIKNYSLVLFLWLLTACQAHSTNGSHNVAVNNADFNEIELNSDEQNTCSPDISDISDFMGIAINAPTEVEFDPSKLADDGSFVLLPICGYYQLNMGELLKDATIQLFAMNIETEKVYRGVLLEEDPGTEEPMPFDEPELQPEDVEGQQLSAYFNPNFTQYVNLPIEEASYKILVQIGAAKSNVVEVRVRQKK